MKITLDLDTIDVDGDCNMEPLGDIVRQEVTNHIRAAIRKSLKENEKVISKMLDEVRHAMLKDYEEQARKIKAGGLKLDKIVGGEK